MKKCLVVFLSTLLMLTMVVGVVAEEKTYDEQLSFTIDVLYPDRVMEDARTQYVMDKFNVDIEFITKNSDAARMWVAGGDIPEILTTGFTVGGAEHTEFVESGLLQPWPNLDDYPNIKAVQEAVGPAVELSIQKNGDRYWFFTGSSYDLVNFLRPQCIYYRVDWAKEVGLFHEDHTYTWDEVMEMAIAFAQQDPAGNGPGNTIGMTGGAYPSMYGLFQNALYYNKFVEKDGAYHWRAGDADVVEAIKDLKYMYDNGAIWEEQIMANSNDCVNKLLAGLAGMCNGVWHIDQLNNLVLGLQETYPGIDVLELISPMKIINDDGTMFIPVDSGYSGEIAISASIDEKVLERFLDMFDWLCSEEGFLLGAIGIEGVDWKYNEAGEIEMLWEKDENGYICPYQPNAHRFVTLPRLHEAWGLQSPAANEKAKILGNRMNDWMQEYDKPSYSKTDWELSTLTPDVAPLYKSLVLSPTVDEKIKELILSSTAETIEADYLAWVESVQGQIKPVEEELTALLCK